MLRVVLIVFGCASVGCSFQSQAPTDMERQYQETYAKSIEAAELRPAGTKEWGKVQPLKVRFYETAGYRTAQSGGDAALKDWLERANEVLVPTLDARLVFESVVDWTPSAHAIDMDGAIEELTRTDPGDDVDFVVGLLPVGGAASLELHDSGRGVVLGKHSVVRAMNSIAELQIIQSLDALSAEERAKLYASRLEHKRTTVLLHELGHNLGALHARDSLWIMHPSYHHEMSAFSPGDRELMAVTLRYRRGELPNQKAWYDALLEVLRNVEDPALWVAADLTAHRKLLGDATLEPEPAAMQQTPAAVPMTGPTAARAAAPERDSAALPEPDATTFREALRLSDAGDLVGAWKQVSPLLARHPISYPVQHLGCTLAMKLTVNHKQRRAACDRMMTLAAQPR